MKRFPMNPMCRAAGLFLLAVACAGCATVQNARSFNGLAVDGGRRPVATIAAENYGYYLFGAFPLVAGVPWAPNLTDWTWFEETVTVENNLDMVSAEAKRLGASGIANVRTSVDWTGSFSMWVFWKKVMKTSAVAVD